MRKLFIHIGTPKTGSTAIQLFLKENNEILKKFHLIYPIDFVKEELRGGYYKSGGNIVDIVNGPFSDEEKAEQIKALADKYTEDIILSCEVISNRIAHDGNGLIEKIKEICCEYDVIIIMYVRPQIDYYESFYSEHVKYWKITDSISEFWGSSQSWERNPRIMDYKYILQEILKVIPPNNCKVQVYEKTSWYQSNICLDFLRLIGITDFESFHTKNQLVNTSIDPITLEMKRIINTLECDAHTLQDIFYVPLLETTRINSGNRLSFSGNLYNRHERDNFMEKYADINRWVAQKFFARDDLFSCADISASTSEPYNVTHYPHFSEQLLLRATHTFSQVLVKQNNEISELNKYIDTVRLSMDL